MSLLDERRPTEPADGSRRGRRADLVTVGLAALLVAAAVVVGVVASARGVPVLAAAPPLLAFLDPHVGPGTPAAIAVAAAVIAWGPGLAARLRWGPLLALSWAAALAWTMSLALVDGFVDGFATRLTSVTEYLHEVPRITDIGVFLERFASLIPNGQPGFWTTHVAGHPPLATLIYVWLDRLGLGGGVWASSVTVVVATSAVVAVAVALRALGAGERARRLLPFGVLFPGAVWVGVSADGLFAAVLAWGVALTALAATADRGGRRVASAALGLAAGLVLGAALFLNYGLAVAMLIPLGVLVLTRSWRPVLPVVVGVAAVTAAFYAAGFWWYDGYTALLLRYSQPGEFGGLRPYAYWVWANLATLVLVVGPAVLVGLRRLGAGTRDTWRAGMRHRDWVVPTVLCAVALTAVALADLSGLSKAEVERIWLPFAVWMLPAAAFVPRAGTRWWLAGQAVLALAVNHLLLTTW